MKKYVYALVVLGGVLMLSGCNDLPKPQMDAKAEPVPDTEDSSVSVALESENNSESEKVTVVDQIDREFKHLSFYTKEGVKTDNPLIGEEGEGETYVIFYSSDCIYCKAAEPELATIAEKQGIEMKAIDVKGKEDVWEQMKLQGVPTVIKYVDGEELHRAVGYDIGMYSEYMEVE